MPDSKTDLDALRRALAAWESEQLRPDREQRGERREVFQTQALRWPVKGLYTPLDLGIGRCRLVVAGPEDTAVPDLPRVATKYPRIAGDHFASKGVVAEIIPVHGSVELAPLVGLSHLIVDIVETGWPADRDSTIVGRAGFGDLTGRLWESLRGESLKALGHAQAHSSAA